MFYARCLYQIGIMAEEGKRQQYPIARSALLAYAEHACLLLKSTLLHVKADDGCLQMLVDIGAENSLEHCVRCIKGWTSSWITHGECDGYWVEQTHVCAVAPEEKESVVAAIDTDSLQSQPERMGQSGDKHCMHIIILTSRARLLLPLKFIGQLQDALKQIAQDAGCAVIAIGAKRNHMHLLCQMPASASPARRIAQAKDRLHQWMLSNPHFRKIDPWDDDTIVFTVSPQKIHQEEYAIAHQDSIHTRVERHNEMSHLYQRLGIPWFASLH